MGGGRHLVSGMLAALLPLAACTSLLGNDFEISDGAGAGGSATSTGGGDVGGVGGVGGGTGDEDCTNGLDDDDDGLIDCEDSNCGGGFVCVPEAPMGWSGPTAVFIGATLPSGCPAAFDQAEYSGFTDLTFGDAVCGACSCGNAQVGCALATIGSWGSTGCAPGLPLGSTNNTGCSGFATSSPQSSFTIGAPTVGNVTCTPSGGSVMDRPPASFDSELLACASTGPVGGGCDAGAACLPQPADDGFLPSLCIVKVGDASCPAPFTEKHLAANDDNAFDDMRDCSACDCAGGTGSCSAVTTVYSNTSCTASIASVPNNGTCVNRSGSAGGIRSRTVLNSNGSCPPSGGMPVGEVRSTAPATTICCLPG